MLYAVPCDTATDMILVVAAAEQRTISVVSQGIQIRGYLTALDDEYLHLYAGIAVDGRASWNIVLVPRDLIVILHETHLDMETDQVRETYLGMAQPFIARCTQHIDDMTSRLTSEEQQ